MAIIPSLEAGASATPQTCERCGSFATLEALGAQQMCAPCIDRVITGARFWSSRYVTIIGAALNPTVSAVLMGLNYRRLGDGRQARNWLIAAGCLALGYAVLLLSPWELPPGALIGISVGCALAIGGKWKPTWTLLSARGAARASVFLPVLFSILPLAGILAALVLWDG